MNLKILTKEFEINNKIKGIIILSLIQLITLLLVLNKSILFFVKEYNFTYNFPKIIDYILVVAIISISLFIGITVVAVIKEDIIQRKCKNNDEILKALRVQKHDFHNHLVVIDGFLQINKVKEAREYLKSITNSQNEIFSVVNIEVDEVSALFYRKLELANSKGITTQVNVDTHLKDIKIKISDLCTILFNLLDNAIYELERCDSEKEKILKIDINEYTSEYSQRFVVIQIINSVPVLSEELYDKVFEAGFSTKTDNKSEHGYGLYKTKQIVEKHKGDIIIDSCEELGTIVTVYLLRK